TVVDAWFGKNENSEFNPDRIFLFWKMAKIETDGDPVDEWTERFSVGSGWEAVEGGKQIQREDGTTRKINSNTDYGRIINRCLGEAGGREGREYAEHFEGAKKVLMDRGEPTEAGVWVGLRFHMTSQEFSFHNKEEDEEVTYNRTLPVAFKGEDDPDGTVSSPAGSESNGSLSKAERIKVEAALKKLAKEADDHADFLDKAMELETVTTHDELLELVADDSDSGLFATARA
ncbi:MAG: hypothetical protein R3324_22225, partial [Halobacteriales archaeon]|nr:hypothetical protein [Halobacteriales archaeon]